MPADSADAAAPVVEVTADEPHESDHRNIERWSVCWLVSAIVNLLILVLAAVLLLPLQRAGGPFTLIATADVEDGDVEKLMSEAADTAALDFGTETEISKLETLESWEERFEVDLSGGTFGRGPGGWQGGVGTGGAGGGTDYFGTVAYGNDFVYILDKSTSMREKANTPGAVSRFARAKYELLRSIDKLAPDQTFYVILFSDTTARMFDDRSRSPSTIPATWDNKERLRKWLDEIPVRGGTDPREALFVAMSITPDAIFFLSDGEFNPLSRKRKKLPFDSTLEAEQLVERMHRGYTPIHTFAYEDPDSKERMEAVARITGGDYKYIAPNEISIEPPGQF